VFFRFGCVRGGGIGVWLGVVVGFGGGCVVGGVWCWCLCLLWMGFGFVFGGCGCVGFCWIFWVGGGGLLGFCGGVGGVG